MLLTRDVLTFAFPPITPSKEMVIYAHTIPSTASRPCFIYPTQNQSHRLAEFHTYQLNSKRGTLVIDGEWDTIELNRSSFSEFTQLGASYPEALVYGWILNDDAFLYLTIDFLPDNTPEPYNHLGVLYIQSGSELQRYIVSQTNKTWGCVGFTYTPRANYQHTIYEFKIPLANIHSQDTIQLMVHLCDG
ncbi:MAG: hypothetical protein D6675_12815 [Gemmatimonadetes bacterium]|nr:MAG: hypothetical protein D6675_12815 [Gemmatimonadota bacterium]